MEVNFTDATEQIPPFSQLDKEGETVSLQTQGTAQLPDPKVAKSRAMKMDLGLGQNSPGYPELYASMARGEEDRLRDNQAYQEHLKEQESRAAIFRSISQNRDGVPFNKAEAQDVSDIASYWGVKVTPELAMEHAYSKALLRNVWNADMVKNITEGWNKGNPDNLAMSFALGQGSLAKREVYRTSHEDAEKRANDASGWSTAGSVAKGMALDVVALGWTPYANIIPGKTFSGSPGSIMQQQAMYINSLPLPEGKRLLDHVTKKMNPLEAESFTKLVLDINNNDSMATNFWTTFSAASVLAPFLKFGKGMSALELERSLNKSGGPEILSEVEKKIMKLKTSPVNADFSRPYFDEFKIISDVEKEALRQRPIPSGNIEAGFPQGNFPNGTMRSMTTPRPMSSYEVQRAFNRINKGGPLTSEEGTALNNSWQQVNTMVKDVVSAATRDSPPKLENIQNAAGDPASAARTVLSRDGGLSPDAFETRLHSILNGKKFIEDPGSFGREVLTRLGNMWTEQADALSVALQGHAKVARLGPELQEAAFQLTEDMMRKRMPRNMANSLINVTRNPADIGNVTSVTMTFGTPDGKPFSSWDAANYVGKVNFGKGFFKIQETAAVSAIAEVEGKQIGVAQFGAGHYLTLTAPVAETDDALRNLAATLAASKGPESMKVPTNLFGQLKRMAFWWNTAAPYTLPESNMQARDIAIHAVQMLQSKSKALAQQIGDLKKGPPGWRTGSEKANMEALFEKDRGYEQEGKIGRFANTVGEFETNYKAEFGRDPSERELAAYFSFRQLNDLDYVVRNLGLYRDLSRQGIENFSFKIGGGKSRQWSPEFWGREIKTAKELPLLPGDKSSGILFNGEYFRTSSMTDNIRQIIRDGINAGQFRAVQIANPLERPLGDAVKSGGDYINFIVTNNFRSRPVEQFSIPYHPGFHREYQATHYVKMPIISRSGGRFSYEGDLTTLGTLSQSEANDYAGKLNEALKLYNANRTDELKDFLAKNLPEEFSYQKFINRFEKGGWNKDETFMVVPKGQTTYQQHGNEMKLRYDPRNEGHFQNEHDSPYNLMRDVDKRFLGSRDPNLWAIANLGSEEAPLVKLENSPMVDIMQSLNRTVSSSTHARLIQDYKYKSAEQFIANFGQYMDVPMAQLRENPQYYLLNANSHWKSGQYTDPVIATAKAARANIIQFIGMDPPDIQAAKWLQGKVSDMLYSKTGGYSGIPDSMIGGVVDPTVYAKKVATHLNLGSYNPFQFVNQLQTVVHTWALGGMKGLQGTMGGIAMARLELTENPAIIKWYDQQLAKANVGWRAGWLEESRAEFKRSGYGLVQGETSWKAEVADSNIIQTGWGKFLEGGLYFFKQGEKGGRLAAWNTAFLEEKARNPNAAFNDAAMGRVLSRARTLNVDMTRAASAPIEQGAWTIPTQFWQYQLRLFGQLNPFSPRLTMAEKARAYAVYGAIYGVPTTLGIPVALWPMYESLRQTALENNIDWTENHLTHALMEGLPSYAMSAITGTDWGQQMGPQGIKAFRELVHNSDAGYPAFVKLLIGASGTKIGDIAKPILNSAMYSVMRGTEDGPFWNDASVRHDWQNAIRTVNTVNSAFRAYYAINLKSYYTKEGRLIADDIEKFDAYMMAVTGLTPRRIADTFLMMDSAKQEKKVKDEAEKQIHNSMRHAMEALDKQDKDAYNTHIARAHFYFRGAGFDQLEWNRMLNNIGKELLPLSQTVPFDFKIMKAPPQRKQENIEKLMGQQ